MQCSVYVDDTDSWGLDLISLTEDCNGGEWCENLLESPASIGLKTCLDCILVEYCVEQIPEIIVIYAIFVCVIFFLDQCCSVNFHEVEIIISAVCENQIQKCFDHTSHCWTFTDHHIFRNRIPWILCAVSLYKSSFPNLIWVCIKITNHVPVHIISLFWALEIFHVASGSFVFCSLSSLPVNVTIG